MPPLLALQRRLGEIDVPPLARDGELERFLLLHGVDRTGPELLLLLPLRMLPLLYHIMRTRLLLLLLVLLSL